MTDEEAARKYASDLTGQGTAYAMFTDDLDDTLEEAFLAGVKHGERKGWDAAREGYYCHNLGTAEDPINTVMVNPRYETFEDWEKEKEK